MKKTYSFKSANVLCLRFQILALFVLVVTQLSCHDDEPAFNPCLQNFQLDNFRPSLHSMDWIPYTEKQVLVFSNEIGEIIKLVKSSNQILTESLRSKINIPCPTDSSQNSYVYYTTHEYQNKFDVIAGNTNLSSIYINIDVLLDEKTSDLDDVHLADVVKIIFNFNNEIPFLVLQFPILDRGYTTALENTYDFKTSLNLRNKSYTGVYFNYENNEELKAYYSESGLVGFEFNNELFLAK